MRILLLAEGLTSGIGGIAIHASELGAALVGRGYDVTLVSPEQFTGRRVVTRWRATRRPCPTAASLRAWELPIIWTPRRAFTARQVEQRWKPWLHRLIASTRADVVHWHGIDVDSMLTRSLPRGPAGVFTNHSSQFLAHAADDARMAVAPFAHATQIITPSGELAERTIAGGIPARRVHIIPNGVDVARYKPDVDARRRFRNRHGIVDDAVVTIAARRMVEKNGVVYLAQAAAELDRTLRQRVVLCFAGDAAGTNPSYMARVRAACEDLRHVDVRWLGWISNRDMPEALAAADIAALPSLVEATSLAGLEAMASGCALLGTRVGGIPELIDDGVTGRLVPPADPHGMADAWRELIEDAATRRRLASAARARVEREFSWGRIAERTERVYQLAVAAKEDVDVCVAR